MISDLFDAAEAMRVAEEMAEDDERATGGPWWFGYATVRKTLGPDDEYSVADLPRVAGDTETRQGGRDGEAIARLRNNAKSAAAQLRAAVVDAERLNNIIRTWEDLSEGYLDRAFVAESDRERLSAEVERLRGLVLPIEGIHTLRFAMNTLRDMPERNPLKRNAINVLNRHVEAQLDQSITAIRAALSKKETP